MSQSDAMLDSHADQSLQQELAHLRQRVQELEADKDTESIKLAQRQALFKVISKIRESLDLQTIFQSTAKEVRELLQADRVGMYRFDFDSDYQTGEFVSEAVLPDYPSALAAKINDHCLLIL